MAVYTTPLWRWNLQEHMPIEAIRCPFCEGALLRYASIYDALDYSFACQPCGLKFSYDTMVESAREGGLRLYDVWPREKQMKPADLLNELEVGDRAMEQLSMEQLFPETMKPAETPQSLLDQIAGQLVSGSMRNEEIAAMVRHIEEHTRRMQLEEANRLMRERDQMIRQYQNVQFDPGIGTSSRRGFWG